MGFERLRQLLDAPRGRDRRDRAHLGVGRAQREQRRLEVGHGAGGGGAEIGLGEDEHVGDLHDACLEELEDVAGGGLEDDRDGVGGVGHLGLGLADADGLDHDHVERGRERFGGRAGGGGEAAEAGPAAVERMNTRRSFGSVSIRARSPSSDPPDRRELGSTASTATDFGRRAPVLDELGEQRGLADAGRAGYADDVGRRLVAERGRGDLGEQRLRLLARVRASGSRSG